MGEQLGARTIQLVPLEMLGPGIQLVATLIVAGEPARRALAAGALVPRRRCRGYGNAIVRRLGRHGL
jgi:hypothetical protein